MVGLWIFLIVICICLTVIAVVYMGFQSDIKDIDWKHYEEIIDILEKIQKSINEMKGETN